MGREILDPFHGYSTVEAFNVARCLDHSDKLDESPQNKKNKRLPQPCFATNYRIRTLPGQSLDVLPEFLD